MTAPVRLQLSRSKGFNLQALSRAYNGREAVNCARPHTYRNPFTITPNMAPGARVAGISGYIAVPTLEDALACFRIYAETEGKLPNLKADLAGKNLACWCKPGDACHCDILLELANR